MNSVISSDMTNGDYVYFTYWSQRLPTSEHPFKYYSRYVDDRNDLQRRQQAFYAVKQVRAAAVLTCVQTDSTKRRIAAASCHPSRWRMRSFVAGAGQSKHLPGGGVAQW